MSDWKRPDPLHAGFLLYKQICQDQGKDRDTARNTGWWTSAWATFHHAAGFLLTSCRRGRTNMARNICWWNTSGEGQTWQGTSVDETHQGKDKHGKEHLLMNIRLSNTCCSLRFQLTLHQWKVSQVMVARSQVIITRSLVMVTCCQVMVTCSQVTVTCNWIINTFSQVMVTCSQVIIIVRSWSPVIRSWSPAARSSS